MRLVIRQHEGAGPVQFGMTREAVATAVGASPRRFRRAPTANETDAFADEGIYVEYGADDACEAVEMASPAVPTLQGRELLSVPYQELRDWVLKLDPAVEMDGAGLISRALGVGFYAPAAVEAPEEFVESVIAFRRGYYD